MGKWENWLQLNFRVGTLALRGAWLTPDHVASGYDQLSAQYDNNWQCFLDQTSQQLVQALPRHQLSPILDLGCGTGKVTGQLGKRFPAHPISAVDISEGMLTIAKSNFTDPQFTFVKSKMSLYLEAQADASFGLIFSSWAIGYEDCKTLIPLIARKLKPGGLFAYVVNLADTLTPLFRTFRATLQTFPKQVKMAAWPKFPQSHLQLLSRCKRSGLDTLMEKEGVVEIQRPACYSSYLPWLLQTGTLAGFSEMIDLQIPEIAQFFEKRMAEELTQCPLQHHFSMQICKKPE